MGNWQFCANRNKPYCPAGTSCLTGSHHRGTPCEENSGNMDSETATSDFKSGLVFRGRVPHESAVSVRGSDGLFQYAWLIRKEEGGFLVDFRCGQERMQIVPFGMVFRLEGVFSVWHDVDGAEPECRTTTVLRENDHIEVLLQSALDEPWKWHPGTLVTADFQRGVFAHVSLSFPSTRTGAVIVPGQQIRRRLDESQLEQSLITSTDHVNGVVHYPLPLDFRVNHAPRGLLAEVFDCLSTDLQTRMRRVCSLWEDVIMATSGRIVNVPYWLSEPCYWHNLWKPTTRVLIVEIRSKHVMEVARFLKRIKEEYGYPQLVGIGLRGVAIHARNSNIFSEQLSNLRDEVALFESTCRFVKLIDPKLECRSPSDYSVLQCEVVAHNKWMDVSAPGFPDRFHASFSVHFNPDIEEDVPNLCMREPVTGSASKKEVGLARDRPVVGKMKHSGMPFSSFGNRENAVAIRGDDGLLHYAQAVAKDNNGLLVDFRDGKPFVFVAFGKIYDYPNRDMRQKNHEPHESVNVLLRLKANEPWKWYPATVSAVTGLPLVDLLLGLVKVSPATGTTVTAVVPYRQTEPSYDPAELEKHLLSNGDNVWVEVHRRLDWEMKINDQPLAVLEEIFLVLGVVDCCRVRLVSKLWNRVAGTVPVSTIHLGNDAQSSMTYLNYVWSKKITTVIIENMGRDFWAVCHALHRFVTQNGCAPLKFLVLKHYNDLHVTYTAGFGISDELSFVASVCGSLVFRKTRFRLRLKLERCDLNLDDDMEEACNMVQIKSGRIDLSSADYAAQFFRMIADGVEAPFYLFEQHCQIDKIRAYFSQPNRSSECVDGVLEVLKDVDNAMRGSADNRDSPCSVKYLLTLQPEKLNRLAVTAITRLIDKYCTKR